MTERRGDFLIAVAVFDVASFNELLLLRTAIEGKRCSHHAMLLNAARNWRVRLRPNAVSVSLESGGEVAFVQFVSKTTAPLRSDGGATCFEPNAHTQTILRHEILKLNTGEHPFPTHSRNRALAQI